MTRPPFAHPPSRFSRVHQSLGQWGSLRRNQRWRDHLAEQVRNQFLAFAAERRQRQLGAIGQEVVEVCLRDGGLRGWIAYDAAGQALQYPAATVVNDAAGHQAKVGNKAVVTVGGLRRFRRRREPSFPRFDEAVAVLLRAGVKELRALFGPTEIINKMIHDVFQFYGSKLSA